MGKLGELEDRPRNDGSGPAARKELRRAAGELRRAAGQLAPGHEPGGLHCTGAVHRTGSK